MRHRYQSIKQLFAKQKGGLELLFEKIETLKMFNMLLQAYLDPFLAPHCEVANFRSGCLVIMADSSSWATRLRYAFPELLNKLRFEAQLYNVVSLQCIVRKEFKKTVFPEKKRLPPPIVEKLFAEMAKDESDPVLSDAFQRLAKTCAIFKRGPNKEERYERKQEKS